MRKFMAGLIIGAVLATTAGVFAGSEVRLIVNGREVLSPDAPPQIINGRTMVPARPLAEALGATVTWDTEKRAVVVSTATDATVNPSVEWEFLRTLAIANKWRAGGSSGLTIWNATTKLFFPTVEVGDITGTTDAGCSVRGRVLTPSSVLLNQADLRACGFMP